MESKKNVNVNNEKRIDEKENEKKVIEKVINIFKKDTEKFLQNLEKRKMALTKDNNIDKEEKINDSQGNIHYIIYNIIL